MKSIIETIVQTANNLDTKGNESLADSLDVFANKLADIKVAQYVGSQGYWVRNSRCWANCYRQKRAQNPDMPAQEVWTSCHEEYVTAMQNVGLGKSTSSWDKYASSESNPTYDEAFHDQFNELIQSHVEAGMERGHAIFAAIDDMEMKPYDELIEASQQAFDMAASMFTSHPQEAVKVAKAGEELVKEAQWWQRRMNDMAAPARGLRQMWNPAVMDAKSQGALLNSINSLTRAMQTVVQERNNLTNLARQSGLEQIAQQIETNIPNESFMQISQGLSRVNEFAQSVVNRETGGEKGNAVQRGLNWLGNQQQQGAEKAKSSEEFFARQRGEQPVSDTNTSFTANKAPTVTPQGRGTYPIEPAPQDSNTYNVQTAPPQSQPQPQVNNAPNKNMNGFETKSPILRTHAPMIPHILNLAPDETTLAKLFQPYVQRAGGTVEGLGSYSKSSNKIEKSANHPQNNKGDSRSKVEDYLQKLPPRDVIALYRELLQHLRESKGDMYSGDQTQSSYGTRSSSSKQVKTAKGKTFNLAKSRNRGVTQ